MAVSSPDAARAAQAKKDAANAGKISPEKAQADTLQKLFGGNNPEYVLDLDSYGRYRILKTVGSQEQRFLWVAPNGRDFSVKDVNKITILQQIRKQFAKDKEGLRKTLYNLDYMTEREYVTKSDSGLNSAMLAAANEFTVDVVDSYQVEGKTKFPTFASWLKARPKMPASGGGSSSAGTFTDLDVKALSSAEINKVIDDTIKSTIGRTPTSEERKQFTDLIKGMAAKGTTTKTIRDAKGNTKRYQSAGYDPNVAAAEIAKTVKTSSPIDYERQQGLSFFDWMQKAESMRGGR